MVPEHAQSPTWRGEFWVGWVIVVVWGKLEVHSTVHVVLINSHVEASPVPRLELPQVKLCVHLVSVLVDVLSHLRGNDGELNVEGERDVIDGLQSTVLDRKSVV